MLILVSDTMSVWSLIDIYDGAKEKNRVPEISSAKSPSEKEQIFVPVVEKSIGVMQSFWDKYCVESRSPIG